MSCVNPFYYNNVRDWKGRLVPVPCNSCCNCRADKNMLVTSRLNYEWTHSKSSAFVTLTYDDLHLPLSQYSGKPTLQRDLAYRFIDTIRHRVQYLDDKGLLPNNVSRDFKYYLVGEYGDKFQRPHYHLLVFGLDFQTCRNFLKKSWPYGSIKILPVQNGAIRYVSKYMSKQLIGNFQDATYFDYGLEPPFCLKSQGIGKGLFFEPKNQEFIREHGYLHYGRKNISVPSYFKNQIIDMSVEGANRYEKYKQSYQDTLMQSYGFGAGFKTYNELKSYRSKAKNDFLRSKNINTLGEVHIISDQPTEYDKEYNYKKTNIKLLVDKALQDDISPPLSSDPMFTDEHCEYWLY